MTGPLFYDHVCLDLEAGSCTCVSASESAEIFRTLLEQAVDRGESVSLVVNGDPGYELGPMVRVTDLREFRGSWYELVQRVTRADTIFFATVSGLPVSSLPRLARESGRPIVYLLDRSEEELGQIPDMAVIYDLYPKGLTRSLWVDTDRRVVEESRPGEFS